MDKMQNNENVTLRSRISEGTEGKEGIAKYKKYSLNITKSILQVSIKTSLKAIKSFQGMFSRNKIEAKVVEDDFSPKSKLYDDKKLSDENKLYSDKIVKKLDEDDFKGKALEEIKEDKWILPDTESSSSETGEPLSEAPEKKGVDPNLENKAPETTAFKASIIADEVLLQQNIGGEIEKKEAPKETLEVKQEEPHDIKEDLKGFANNLNNLIDSEGSDKEILAKLEDHYLQFHQANVEYLDPLSLIQLKDIFFEAKSKILNRAETTDVSLVAQRLEKNFQLAQKQQRKEENNKTWKAAHPENIEGKNPSIKLETSEKIAGVGVASMQGRRGAMEDTHIATEFSIDIRGVEQKVKLFGVFDGHGTSECSEYIRDNIQKKLQENLEKYLTKADEDPGSKDTAIYNALKRTCVNLHNEFNEGKDVYGKVPGSAANFAVVLENNLYIANIGDSRAIMCQNGMAITLSRDAKLITAPKKKFEEKMTKRSEDAINRRGGEVIGGRIGGIIKIGGAIGDPGYLGINPRPNIVKMPLEEIKKQGGHLVIVCDGITDVAASRQIAKTVGKFKDKKPEEIGKHLVTKGYNNESLDNMTAMVIEVSSL